MTSSYNGLLPYGGSNRLPSGSASYSNLTTMSNTAADPERTSTAANHAKSSGSNTSTRIVGGVIAGCAAALLLVGLIVCWFKRSKTNEPRPTPFISWPEEVKDDPAMFEEQWVQSVEASPTSEGADIYA
jgi:hypothetical protein